MIRDGLLRQLILGLGPDAFADTRTRCLDKSRLVEGTS